MRAAVPLSAFGPMADALRPQTASNPSSAPTQGLVNKLPGYPSVRYNRARPVRPLLPGIGIFNRTGIVA